MEKKIVQTADGSKTIAIPKWNESYHSKHGAWQESQHVFIQMGLAHTGLSSLSIFEMGFGTGLNAIQALLYAEKHQINIDYHTLEAYPLEEELWQQMDYEDFLPSRLMKDFFGRMHRVEPEQSIRLADFFRFTKYHADIHEFLPPTNPDLVFYDAFGPRVQPDLWTSAIFERLHSMMSPGAILTTYCAKGEVRRTFQSLGMEVERLPGPPGKREMLRATKAK